MECLYEADKNVVILDLRTIFNEKEFSFEKVEMCELPDNVLADILNTSFTDDKKKMNINVTEIQGRSTSSESTLTPKMPNRFKLITKDKVDEIAGKSCKK